MVKRRTLSLSPTRDSNFGKSKSKMRQSSFTQSQTHYPYRGSHPLGARLTLRAFRAGDEVGLGVAKSSPLTARTRVPGELEGHHLLGPSSLVRRGPLADPV